MPRNKTRFYISSRAKNAEKAKKLARLLENRGYKFLDWTKFGGLGRPYQNKSEAPLAAKEMTEMIKRADVFVLFPDLRGGTGMFVEMGVALAAKKKIYIVAPRITRPIFFFHPLVTRVKSTKELLKIL